MSGHRMTTVYLEHISSGLSCVCVCLYVVCMYVLGGGGEWMCERVYACVCTSASEKQINFYRNDK